MTQRLNLRSVNSSTLCLAAALALLLGQWTGATAQGAETLPEGLKIERVEVWPAQIELSHKFDYRQLLITGYTAEGERVDVTRIATLAQPGKVVKVDENRTVRPLADGSEPLVFQVAGQSVTVNAQVTGFAQPYHVGFIRDVQPTMSKLGCNQGTCHGSKDGKNGFKLSLRGYDAEYDHRALTDDVSARRINRAAPDQSLMLLKASGAIPHVGGVLTTSGEPYYELLRAWIAAGVKLDRESPRVTSIEIFPKNPIVPLPKMKQQIAVLATYSDGAVRDVTAEAFVESGNTEVAEADVHGVMTTLRRGEAPVLVRYEGSYAATTVTVMGDRSGFAWRQMPVYNFIDELVDKKLQRVKVLPSELCSDEEFVRRVYLDLTGLPPTADQTVAFLSDQRASRDKRDALVDALIGSGPFVEHWSNKWADLLLVNSKFLGERGAVNLRNWIKQAVAANVPYDQFAHQVLTASGSTAQNPPAAYFKVLRDPTEAMENTTQLFLAVRFSCNKCHDHPFERWTQSQYYHLAAYFAQVGRKEDPAFAGKKIGGTAVEGAKPLVEVVYDVNSGDVKHLLTGQVAKPEFPYQSEMDAEEGTRRERLADWITSPENQYFAKSYANRLWGYLFGVGIIEPIDDIRAGNPPTNPELLDRLTREFIEHDFDTQHILRLICKSRTYQLSVTSNQWNEDDEINYSHAIPRRLPAEVLYDAIHVASGTAPQLPGVPTGFRAAQLPDVGVKIPFLDDFGRPVRETSCECERSSGMVLGPIMKLVNGPTVARAISAPESELTTLIANEADDAKVVQNVFLRFLSRYPTKEEEQLGIEALHAADGDLATVEAKLAAYQKSLPEKLAAWEKSLSQEIAWTTLKPTSATSTGGATLTVQPDGAVLASGAAPDADTYTIVASTDATGVSGIRLEALSHDSLPSKGPGRAENGNFVLNEFLVTAAPKAQATEAAAVELAGALADFSQSGYEIGKTLDGSQAGNNGWAVSPEFGKPHLALYQTKADLGHEGGTVLTITLPQGFGKQHTLGHFRLSITTAPRPVQLDNNLPAPLVKMLETPADKRTAEQQAALLAYYEQQDPALAQLKTEVAAAQRQSANQRLIGVQDLAWALINNPAFLFNR